MAASVLAKETEEKAKKLAVEVAEKSLKAADVVLSKAAQALAAASSDTLKKKALDLAVKGIKLAGEKVALQLKISDKTAKEVAALKEKKQLA